ncbi:LysR family transcriptional regulator [Denitromonas ohlonensis]|uniref:LysR family transcriptional regulator n=2 Tax=Denitromonas TaxID=139331 RepID=A0A557SKS2_9RHOO|nr:LysR family transcriptional regulator [Denitromonas ohlonensis]TVO68145.1 LysR family transcriptional regulator [Denitromonas ohlonensis]TVO77950.1 LysR family transcriptional regulator [Denitromonas ohlonensis]
MDTDCVRLFVLAAEKLNISAAGRELGMAPAVASVKLAKLEKTLGADLLRRSTRKVSLSLEGAEFLPYAREILAQESAAHAALGRGNMTATGTLRFTAPSTFAQLYIAPILPAFLALHPGISLDLRLTDMAFDLIQGSFDLALRNSALADSSLKGRKLADDTRILCASPDYLKQHGTPSHPDDLAAHQLIAFKEVSPLPLIGRDGSTGQFNPRQAGCRLVMDDGLSYKIATLAGAGISVNSLWSVHRELAGGTLVHVLPDYQVDDPVALWLVYPKSNVLTAKVRIFIDFLMDRIGKAPPWHAA